MDKLAEPTPERWSPQSRNVLQAAVARVRRHWDFLAVLLLVLVSMPVMWFSPGALFIRRGIDLIEDSWILDTSFKASRGLWFGRDVAFTYGPLFQYLSSAPARWAGLSMGTIFASYATLGLWWTFLAGYLTLRLLLPEQPPWKRFLLLLLLCVFWTPRDGRTAFAVFLFALFLRGWYEVQDRRVRPALLGSCAAVMCAAAFLYSADTGVYGLAALLVSLAGVAWEGRRRSHTLSLYASALLAFAALAVLLLVAINAVVAHPLDFSFWRNSLAIINGYRWFEPDAISGDGTAHLLRVLLVGGVVFLARGVTGRDRDHGITARTGFLLSGFAFALVTMQSGLVRSDWVHIVIAVYPMVFLVGAILFSFASRPASALSILLVAACSWSFGEPPALPPATVFSHAKLVGNCPADLREFDRVCYPPWFTDILQRTAGYVQQRSGPRDFMLVFPYQTFFGIASRRNVAGGVMQSFLASGAFLSQVDIAGLEREAPPVGLFLPDGTGSLPLDGVTNFTRTPEVFFWMFRHYESEQEVAHGVFGLRKEDSRAARISMELKPLGLAAQTYTCPARNSLLDLGAASWPAGADFLRLRLTVRYSFWWKLRKPQRLLLWIERADGSYDTKSFIVEPNVSSDVWFYPWNDADLAHYLAGDESRWRSGPRSPITHLRLWTEPLDWISIQPEAVVLESADSITVSLRR